MTDSLADHPAQPDLATPQEPTPPLSNQQLAANRRNALRSSGPRTAAGKAVARDNALKHGFLSRHLLIKGESAADFQQLLDELMREYRPVGVVETGLVEQVAICLWRKARFVRAEAAMVNLNRRTFGEAQAREVAQRLGLPEEAWRSIPAPLAAGEDEDPNLLADLVQQRAAWQALIDEEVIIGPAPFARLPETMQAHLLQIHGVDAGGIDAVILAEYGSWEELVAQHLRLFDELIEKQRIREVSLLVMESQALPTQTELLTRYQTTLDNDLYKALKALREAQAWREARAALEASAVPAT
ncbi:MAG: hypothetical protein EOM92_16835 [Gammaproteobacteria bacterium]|jgi:hypothetical protein|nr:hypothetical protein [Gammaproteobacteria bacterium]